MSVWSCVHCFIQLQGAFIFLLLSGGWFWAGVMRRRECLRQQALAAEQDAALGTSPSAEAAEAAVWPQVSVVLPVKGCRMHSLSNWRSQVQVQYPGAMEFLFVLESKDDPSFAALEGLASGCHVAGSRAVHVIEAGLSSTCSQKIYNQCAGVRACSPSSRYVLFLDDDVELHPRTVLHLVSALERDTTLYMATGYPFDVPPPGSGLPTYCTLVYHLPLLIGLSAVQRSHFVWGGCALMRAEELRQDRHSVLQGWMQGGYSDDLILAAKCSEHNLPVAVPSAAIFPQWLEPRTSWRQYMNYLHRQLYVLDTYITPHNAAVNHAMMAFHTWASTAAVLPCIIVCYRAFVLLRCTSSSLGLAPPSSAAGLSSGAGHCLGPWTWAWDGTTLVFIASCVLAHCGLYFMTVQVLRLFSLLSPRRPRIHVGQYNWAKLWLAFLLENLVLPSVMGYVYFTSCVDWGGTKYYKQAGRIVRVEHPRSNTKCT